MFEWITSVIARLGYAGVDEREVRLKHDAGVGERAGPHRGAKS